MLTKLEARHRKPIEDILRRTKEFVAEDVSIALELIDSTLSGKDDYRFWIDVDESQEPLRVRGYICFDHTPMTQAAYDLYWIAVDPIMKGEGIGRGLVMKMEDEIRKDGARVVRVETAGAIEYTATRAFYERLGFEESGRLRDFYWPKNDLVIYAHYLT